MQGTSRDDLQVRSCKGGTRIRCRGKPDRIVKSCKHTGGSEISTWTGRPNQLDGLFFGTADRVGDMERREKPAQTA
jgi:hypothetical protein